MSLSTVSYAQRKMVTQTWNKTPLADVLKSLEKADKYKFNFNYDDVNRYTVTAVIKNRTVLEALNIALINKPLQFSVDELMITIKPKKSEVSQIILLKGKVVDSHKKPIVGAAVVIEGLAGGTATDKDGNFELKTRVSDPVVMFSSIGYKPVKIIYTGPNSLSLVVMQEDVAKVDEVTVIGYGERSKKEMIGSVSSVKADELKENPSPNVMTMLQGRLAGVEITNQSGAPGGGGAKVAIRGYTAMPGSGDLSLDGSPLYVVDGIPINSETSKVTGASPLAMIDPATIESVDVLKDAASASIYGSRAGNGVVLITTKKGRKGQSAFMASATYSISQLPSSNVQTGGNLERLYKIEAMKSARVATYKNVGYPMVPTDYKYPTSYLDQLSLGGNCQYDKFWNQGKGYDSKILQDSLNPFYNNSTNWFKSSFRIGKVLNANLQANGGSEKMQYMMNVGYYNEIGIMHASQFGRVNFVSNVSAQPTKRISIDANIGLSYADRSNGVKSDNSFQNASRIESMTSSPFETSTLLASTGAIKENYLNKLNSTVIKQDDYNIRASLEARYEIIKGLVLSSNGGIDYGQSNTNIFEPSFLDDRYHENKSTGKITRGVNIQNENLLKYRRSFNGVHNMDLLAGLSLTKDQSNSIMGYGKGNPSDLIHYYISTIGTGINTSGYEPRSLLSYLSDFRESSMVSYFGRAAYNYKQRYLIEASIRRDGSSMFGEDNQYATFPAVAVGWNISEEAFMDPLWWIDIAKIRASWGTSGQVYRQEYLAHGILAQTETVGGVAGMAPIGILNRDLTWEKSNQYDFGFDLNMFNYRYNLKLDYYYKYTSGMLYEVQLPGGFYYTTGQIRNAMETSNEGLELEFKAEIFRDTPFKWRLGFNISRNWNRFEKSYQGVDMGRMIIGRPLYILKAFDDAGGYYQNEKDVPQYFTEDGLKVALVGRSAFDGEYYSAGTRKIKDIDGNGMINEGDMSYVGSSLPQAYGGMTHDFSYKGFSLNLHFNYSLCRKIFATYLHKAFTVSNPDLPILNDVAGTTFWQKEGDMTQYPSINNFQKIMNTDAQVKSKIENVSYLKLQQIVLGYTMPEHWMKKIGIDGLRLYVTGENLFTISNYSGIDPELVSISDGIDTGQGYPMSRKFTIGVTLNF